MEKFEENLSSFKVGDLVQADFDGRLFSGTVTEVHTDYLLVNVPEVSNHCRYEPDFNLDTLKKIRK